MILAALPEEADAFRPGEGEVSSYGNLPVRRIAGRITIATCGLGKVNAALAVGLLVNQETQLVAMTGTCGRLAAVEGDCFWIARAIQHDYGARKADGHVPYRAGDWPMGKPRDIVFTAMSDPGLGLPHATIASGDLFLECPDTAADLASRLGAELVDMEVAAMAQAAETLGLRWAAIKAVTDDADGGSAGNFNANLRKAARRAGEAIERLVENLPPD